MPLDAAEFISELSITDPTGTDPLNQGDDQIRTTKRATQQSFPLVDAAVNISAAQMNQMAIKNEANAFTQINRFAQVTLFNDGSAGAPSISFTDQQSTGFYRPGTSIGFTIAGVDAAFLLPAQFRMIQNGAAAAPAYGFQNNTGNGMYLESTGVLAFAVNGVRQARVFDSAWAFFQPVFAPVGSTAAPSYSFQGRAGQGFSSLSDTIMVASSGGSERMRWQSADATLFTLALAAGTDGTAAIPSYSWFAERTAGWYRAAAGQFAFSISSGPKFSIASTGTAQIYQGSPTLGSTLNFVKSNGVVGYNWQFEGAAGFQPEQFSLARFNRTTGAFIDIPLYINATTGRVHTALPVLSP